MKNSASSDTASLERRAARLRVAGALWAYPDNGRVDYLRALLREVKGPPGLEQMLTASTLVELQTEHFRLFGPDPAAGLELSVYLSESEFQQSKIMADMSGFYAAFGLGFRAGLRPDALPVALEFASHLLLKEANAQRQGLKEARAVTRKARQDFAKSFLIPALAAFSERLGACLSADFFTGAAEFCKSEAASIA